ncbi:hypothetical protein [Paraburkholderia sp. HP33-1]|uniref:hypothetical protein n=1 Tax=Paraburkholderia sp. HP33-1 TaxID=2883243 RepID=UPI001F42B2DD|nr:hypothetical protein [Paraburkholderia sp. HP33-1]
MAIGARGTVAAPRAGRFRAPAQKIFLSLTRPIFVQSQAVCTGQRAVGSTNRFGRTDPINSERLKAVNVRAIASFCCQIFGAAQGLCGNVQAHISMRFASVRVVTMFCGADFAAVALQNYSYLGNLPPLVSRLRVNV